MTAKPQVSSPEACAVLQGFDPGPGHPAEANAWYYQEGPAPASERKFYYQLDTALETPAPAGDLTGNIWREENPITHNLELAERFHIQADGEILKAPFGLMECLTRRAPLAVQVYAVLLDIEERAARRAKVTYGFLPVFGGATRRDYAAGIYVGAYNEALGAARDILQRIRRADACACITMRAQAYKRKVTPCPKT